MPLDDFGKGKDQGKAQGQAEGFGEEGGLLLPEQVIGADAHHEEARQDVGPADGVEEDLKGEGLGDHRQKVREFGPAVSEDEAHRVLHPGIGDQDPHR